MPPTAILSALVSPYVALAQFCIFLLGRDECFLFVCPLVSVSSPHSWPRGARVRAACFAPLAVGFLILVSFCTLVTPRVPEDISLLESTE